MTNTETGREWNPKLYNDKHSYVHEYGETLIRLLNPQPKERILDLGCGSGQLTFEISKQAGEVVGIDKSPEMISDAKQKFPQLDFEVADAAKFAFSKKFDAIFSNAALHWVLDYKGAIRSMYENLKPGGRIVLEFGGKGNVATIVNQLRLSLSKRGFEKQSQLELWYFPSIGGYTSELEKQGFYVAMAAHFDRPTALADEKTGIMDWVSMFGKKFFEGVSATETKAIKQEVQEEVKAKCFAKGQWFAHYKRIRMIGFKER